jgi:hypothetical protein
VHIWNDPWIPQGITRRPCSHHGHNLIQWVSDLIDPTTGSWDENLVRQTFHSDDVRTILAIPVHEDLDDVICWHFDSKGIFSVKSAYKVYIDNDSEGQGSSTGNPDYHSASGGSLPWQKIWQMKCPNKVKTFAWWLSHNSLPRKRKFESRGVELDTRCPVCWRLEEDTSHLLLKCKFTKAVWCELQLDHLRLDLAVLSSAREVFYYIWRCDIELQLKLITLMWVLTTERNAVNAGERMKSSGQVGMQIQRYYLEFMDSFAKKSDTSSSAQPRWNKPRSGYMKINIDASYRGDKDWGLGLCDSQ